jgi:IS30 family transposase
MDFVEGLPKSEGFDTILVVVDIFFKYAHFISLKHPYTAQGVAQVFLDTMVKLHGAPKTIVSDRDKVFTSSFWTQLFHLMGAKLLFSSAYHPHTDGQTERVNQCLEQYLRCAVHDHPHKRRQWLDLAEFWYNTTYHCCGLF